MFNTIGSIWDRVNTVVASQGFIRSKTAFTFDNAPDAVLDAAFCVTSRRSRTDGYIGGDQAELHQFDIFVARRVKRDPYGAQRQLKVDLDFIEAALISDMPVYDYNLTDDGIESECQERGDYIVGRLRGVLDFDRDIDV